jgi:crotonobetainyl-CoA:carnitine CoA-transferase CaiB-like acyl-CoA transferase
MSESALEGLRVADFAWVVAGPCIGRTLADFGATVVRVESSRRVDTARLMGPFPAGERDSNRSGLYDNCNAGKLGLALDLAVPEARDAARRLIGWADVVIESFAPGQMSRWDLGYDELRVHRPDLVMLSTSLMGQSGCYASLAGFGNIGAAMSGFQPLVGLSGEPPIGPYGPYTDYVAPRFGLCALLAALERRRRTGEGCWLDISQTDAGLQFLAPQLADYFATDRSPRAEANRDRAMAPHGVYRCIAPQSWIAIAVRDDEEWQRLAPMLGPAAAVESYRTLAGRKSHEDMLDALLGEWTLTQSAPAAEARLQAAGIAAHVVASSADMLADPQLQARQHFVRLPHVSGGESVVEGPRFQLSETPGCVARSAPTYGRDNGEVLREILGFDDAEIAALDAAGALR